MDEIREETNSAEAIRQEIKEREELTGVVRLPVLLRSWRYY